MWGLKSRSRTSRSRSQSRLLWQSLGLVSKFEPGLGLGGYGLDYITAVQQTNSEALLTSALFAVKNTLFRPYCMPMYACQLWIKYTQTNMKRLRAAYNNAYRIMHYITYPDMLLFAHTRLSIVSEPLMSCWETTCIDFLYDTHFHPIFLYDRFKCLMLFTNLHFSSIIQRSSIVETECSSCSWIVSVFASDQYCFCVVKICGHCVHTTHKKSKCWESVLLLSRLDTY